MNLLPRSGSHERLPTLTLWNRPLTDRWLPPPLSSGRVWPTNTRAQSYDPAACQSFLYSHCDYNLLILFSSPSSISHPTLSLSHLPVFLNKETRNQDIQIHLYLPDTRDVHWTRFSLIHHLSVARVASKPSCRVSTRRIKSFFDIY